MRLPVAAVPTDGGQSGASSGPAATSSRGKIRRFVRFPLMSCFGGRKKLRRANTPYLGRNGSHGVPLVLRHDPPYHPEDHHRAQGKVHPQFGSTPRPHLSDSDLDNTISSLESEEEAAAAVGGKKKKNILQDSKLDKAPSPWSETGQPEFILSSRREGRGHRSSGRTRLGPLAWSPTRWGISPSSSPHATGR